MFKKDFNLMVIGQIISIFGASLLRFALSLHVLDVTGSEAVFAALFTVSSVPMLLSPLGGAIADRFNRRNLMVIFDFTSSGIILIFSFLLPVMNGSVFLIGAVMVLLAVISALYTPAVIASIPLLVDESKLTAANGIVQAVQALSMVAAPVIGGLLYGALGTRNVVIFSCAAFFLSAVMEIFIKIPFKKREISGSIVPAIVKDLKEGFSYTVKQPFIFKSIIVAVFLNFLLTPLFIVGVPIIFRVTLNLSEGMYGIGMGIVESSTIIGALTAGLFTSKLKISNLWYWLLAVTVLLAVSAVSVSPWTAGLPAYILILLCTVPIAAICTILSIYIISLVQKETPNEMLGKVMAICMAVAQCAAPLGQLVYGFMFQAFRSAVYLPILTVSGAMLILTFVIKKLFITSEDAA